MLACNCFLLFMQTTVAAQWISWQPPKVSPQRLLKGVPRGCCKEFRQDAYTLELRSEEGSYPGVAQEKGSREFKGVPNPQPQTHSPPQMVTPTPTAEVLGTAGSLKCSPLPLVMWLGFGARYIHPYRDPRLRLKSHAPPPKNAKPRNANLQVCAYTLYNPLNP